MLCSLIVCLPTWSVEDGNNVVAWCALMTFPVSGPEMIYLLLFWAEGVGAMGFLIQLKLWSRTNLHKKMKYVVHRRKPSDHTSGSIDEIKTFMSLVVASNNRAKSRELRNSWPTVSPDETSLHTF